MRCFWLKAGAARLLGSIVVTLSFFLCFVVQSRGARNKRVNNKNSSDFEAVAHPDCEH